MAEGGMEYDNPEFDRDDYDDMDITDQDFEEGVLNLSNHIGEVPDVDTKTKLIVEQKQSIVNEYYKLIKEKYNLDPVHIDISNFELGPDNKTLLLKVGDREIQLTSKRGNGFINLQTLAIKIGSGGTATIKDLLSLPDYSSSVKSHLNPQVLIKTRDEINKVVEEIPLQDISSQQEGQELLDVTNEAETEMEAFLEELFDDEQKETGTQTDMTKREMDGILKAMTSVKEEIANELTKLNETNKDIAKENTKLEQAKADNDEFQIKRITDRIKELESERSARLEVINVNKDKLRSQVNRIKDTINKMLKEDTTLGERIRTLFREQGITIVSVLTAFGMIIGLIVESVIPTTSGTTTPKPPPKDGSGVKDWVKKQLSNLGKLLSTLAGKAAAALPGIIGSIVSWLLSSAGKVVGWFGEHLWALVVLVAGLLYASAREFIRKKRT